MVAKRILDGVVQTNKTTIPANSPRGSRPATSRKHRRRRRTRQRRNDWIVLCHMTNSAVTRSLQVCLPIFVGGTIYTLFGSPALWVFDWYAQLGLTDFVTTVRGLFTDLRPLLPAWVLYSLPDGLWVYAYTSLMLNIWRVSGRSTIKTTWILSGVVLAVGTELGQLLGLVVGTFDIWDIYFYATGFLLALLWSARVETEEVELCTN